MDVDSTEHLGIDPGEVLPGDDEKAASTCQSLPRSCALFILGIVAILPVQRPVESFSIAASWSYECPIQVANLSAVRYGEVGEVLECR